MKPYSLTYDITLMAVMVACNAALELTLGTFLHAVHFPLTGSLMVVVNALAYALAYSYYPRFGRITLMGIASAIVSMLLAGGLKFMMLPALITEALVIDIAISLAGLNRWGFVSAGAWASLTSFLWKLLNMHFFRGMPLDLAVKKIAEFGIGVDALGWVLTWMVLGRLAVGAVFAVILWSVYKRLSSCIVPALRSDAAVQAQAEMR